MEQGHGDPPPPGSGCAAQRSVGDGGGPPRPWQAAPATQSLPSPKELCRRRRRRGPKRGGPARGFSVLYHLEEVKRRQSHIDRQKAAQEGGSLPQPSPHGHGAPGDPPAQLPTPAGTPEPFARPFLGRGASAQLLLPSQWDPGLPAPLRFPPGSPPPFYAVAAHQRCPPGWGAELRPEE